MNRRGFLVTGMGAAAAAAFARPSRALATAKPEGSRWRAFEVTTRLEIQDSDGSTRGWVPLPLATDTTYQKGLGHSWTGNAASTRVVHEERYGAGIFCAECRAGEGAPFVEVTTRFATLDRATDVSRPDRAPVPDKRSLGPLPRAHETHPHGRQRARDLAEDHQGRSPCLGRSGDITKAQHCRAEVHLESHGWLPVDPADVRKVVPEENGGLPLADPLVQRERVKLFGAWEMNWLGFNYAHDLTLPGSAGSPLPFFMYPQAEAGGRRRDCLDPDGFRYRITAKELTA